MVLLGLTTLFSLQYVALSHEWQYTSARDAATPGVAKIL